VENLFLQLQNSVQNAEKNSRLEDEADKLLTEKPFTLLSYGVFFIIVALCLAISVSGFIELFEVPSIVIALSGLWIIVLAILQEGKQDKYARSTFSTLSWGLIISTIGFTWFLYSRQIFVEYLPVMFLLVIGILIIIAALRHWKK